MKKNIEKVTGQKRNKRQRIMATVVASISSVALLTTATYAWFSLTNAAQVNQLTLKAGTTGSLLISEKADSGFAENISLTLKENCCLRPLTTKDGKGFFKPIYDTDGIVKKIDTKKYEGDALKNMANKLEVEGGWLIEKEFYLLANTQNEKTTATIKLLGPNGEKIGENDMGTIISNAVEGEHGAEAVRISFTCDNDVKGGSQNPKSVTKILEPNADVTVADLTDPNQAKLEGWADIQVIKQNENSLFKNAQGEYTENISEELFTIPTNVATKVVMRIWLEGADSECVNKIVGKTINTQIRFISDDMN